MKKRLTKSHINYICESFSSGKSIENLCSELDINREVVLYHLKKAKLIDENSISNSKINKD